MYEPLNAVAYPIMPPFRVSKPVSFKASFNSFSSLYTASRFFTNETAPPIPKPKAAPCRPAL